MTQKKSKGKAFFFVFTLTAQRKKKEQTAPAQTRTEGKIPFQQEHQLERQMKVKRFRGKGERWDQGGESST